MIPFLALAPGLIFTAAVLACDLRARAAARADARTTRGLDLAA